MACLFVLLGGIFPRFALIIVWIARPKMVDAAFDTWIWPLLGFLFLPFATLIYVILWQAGWARRLGLVLGVPGGPARPRPLGRLRHPASPDAGLPLELPGVTDR